VPVSVGPFLRTVAMASLVCRSLPLLARRTVLLTASRASSGEPHIDPMKGKVASDKMTMPDTLGHAVGAERFELLAKLHGNNDPFEMDVRKRAKGTKDEPTLIPSMYDKRLVGCICEEDSITPNWMYLHKGESKRCACGYWFKMVELPVEDYGQL